MPGAMERLDHVAELVQGAQRVLARAVPLVGGEEGHGAIPPVVHQARRRVLRVELKDRQELHRGHPEVHQVGNLLDQAGIGAARRRRHPGAGVPREAGDVQLVDHGLRERALQRRIPLPVIGLRIRHRALHGDGRVRARLLGGPAAVARGHRHGLPVGVQEHLVRVEPQAAGGVAWPVHPIAVELPGRETRHEDMPVVVRAMPPGIEADDAGRLGLLHVIEQQQFHQGGALGEHAEVDPLRGEGRPERKTSPGPDGCIAQHGLPSLLRGDARPAHPLPQLCHKDTGRPGGRCGLAVLFAWKKRFCSVYELCYPRTLTSFRYCPNLLSKSPTTLM